LTVIIKSSPNDVVSLAIARSLGKTNTPFTVYSKNSKPLASYSKYCKNTLVSQNDSEFFLRLSSFDIVFPIDETGMLQLAKNKKKLNCLLAFSDHPTLETVINKSLLTRHALEQNIPCPETVFIDQPEDIKNFVPSFEFPAVMKPISGSGGKGITFVKSIREFHNVGGGFFEKYGPFILQEKIPFINKYTVGVLCNSESKVKRVCVIKEIRNYPVETGPACYAETVQYPELLSLSIKLMESLNYFGVADIDFLVDLRTGKPKLMEINPRFWGSLQLAINAGVDFPNLLFELMENGDIKKSFEYKTGIRCRHLIFDDTLRLFSILKGHYELSNKVKSIRDFLTFHPDDGYYIFSLNDIKPFMHHLKEKFQKAQDF
jgi:predicted ATP-grasp superfamily ATP-dependent carboligase